MTFQPLVSTDDLSLTVPLKTTAASAVTATMPSAVSTMALEGRPVTVLKVDGGAGAVTVDGESAQTVNGAATVSLASQYKYVTMISDGANWVIIGSN